MSTSLRQDIERPCLGCGCALTYQLTVWSDATAPEILPPLGAIAYRGGHLCPKCGEWVAKRLSDRRRKQAPLTFRYANGSRECAVSSAESAVAVWEAYLARTGYGVSEAGNGGEILDSNGAILFRISYNGRIWNEAAQRFADAG